MSLASIASAAGPAYTVELAHPAYRGTMAGKQTVEQKHRPKHVEATSMSRTFDFVIEV